MATNRIAGITLEIGGDTSNLQKSLKSLDGSLKTTQNTLKDIDKLLKLDPGNVELLTQKQKSLQSAIQGTSQRLTELKNAQSGVEQGSAEWDALQREIIETEQKLKGLKEEYKDFGSVAAQQVAAVGQKMEDIGGKVAGVGAKLTTSVTAPIVAGFTVAANSASDYEENLNKIGVAFGDSAEDVTAWATNAQAQFGLSKLAATDAVSAFGALGKGIGLSSGVAADMSTTLAGLSADLASYFNTGTDQSAKALEGIFTGETEALKKFGVVMNETNLKAFAEEQGLVYSELDQTEKTLLRYNYVLERTGDASGDYARSADGTANSLKTFQAATSDAAVAIGTQLLPVITPLIQDVTSLINRFAELSPETQNLIVKIGLAAAAAGPLLTVGGKLTQGIGTVMTLVPKLVGALAAINPTTLLIVGGITVLVAAIKNWGTVSSWISDIWGKLTGFFKKSAETQIEVQKLQIESSQTMANETAKALDNAGTWISAKWGKVTDFFKKSTEAQVQAQKLQIESSQALAAETAKAFDNLKTQAAQSWESLKTKTAAAWEGLKTTVSTKADEIKTAASQKWESLKTETSTAWDNIKTGVSTKAEEIKGAVSGKWTELTNAASTWGTNLLANFSSGINGEAGNTYSALQGVTGWISTILGWTADGGEAYGGNLLSNYINGLWGKSQDLWNTVSSLASDWIGGGLGSVVDWAKNWGSDMIQNYINGIWDKARDLWNTVASVAQTVSDYLGFSVPDKGPLADADTYMPDFMQLLASGIKKNAYLVDDALNIVAGGFAGETQPGQARGSGAGTSYSYGDTQIVINAAPGMDVNALADAVQDRLVRLQQQREAVYA